MGWEDLDAVYCISLASRDDRFQAAKTLAETLGIPVEFHRPVKDPEGGEAGCFRSHLACIRKAYEAGHTAVAIFEDDFRPTSALNSSTLDNCFKFMKENTDWNLFYFGILPTETSSPTPWTRVWKGGGYAAHAYVIHRRLMAKIYSMDWPGIPIDLFYQRNDQAYFHSPSLFCQKTEESSDIRQTSWWDRVITSEPYFNFTSRYTTHRIEYTVAAVLLVLVVFVVVWLAGGLGILSVVAVLAALVLVGVAVAGGGK